VATPVTPQRAPNQNATGQQNRRHGHLSRVHTGVPGRDEHLGRERIERTDRRHGREDVAPTPKSHTGCKIATNALAIPTIR
jgi:hypothetical protein